MLMEKERQLIIEYGIKMNQSGLCPGTSGNLSIFCPERKLIAISPSGIDYYKTKAEDVVITDLEGNIVDGERKPSSELMLHSAFYKKKDNVRAIVHTHSIYCCTFAALGMPLNAAHLIIADADSDHVPCAPYETFGSPELAATAAESCGDGKAVLLANHGIVCCGGDIKSAYSLAVNMEYLAQIQYQAMCIGKPNFLSADQIEDVIRRFKGYGQK